MKTFRNRWVTNCYPLIGVGISNGLPKNGFGASSGNASKRPFDFAR